MPRTSVARPSSQLNPSPQTPKTDEAWQEWFNRVFQTLYEGGAAKFPKVTVANNEGSGSFHADSFMVQELLSVDCGIYSHYSSDNGSIIYGFACNVTRSAGNQLTVAAQLNAIGPRQGTGTVFGVATTALGGAEFAGAMVGMETTPANVYHDNRSAKVGLDAVFKDRGDGATTVTTLGSNRYNYFACAHWITSQPRSATGELCGWTRGMSFLGECLDEQTPPAWNAAVTYSAGMVVSSGGVLWQAITTSLNQVPAVPSAFWVQHTAAGVVALAIGIDFSSVPLSVLARTSSAIRLRDTMRIDWEVTGTVGTYFDPATGALRLCNLGAVPIFAVNAVSGELFISRAVDALGGGAGAALGTIGGTGPTVAGQNSWMRFTHPVLGNVFIPIWI